MTGYMCKYAPLEILSGFGLDAELILPCEGSLDVAESYIYPSMCSYAKSVLQHTFQTPYDSILFTDCCDAMKRIADVLEHQPNQTIFSVNLPRLADQQGSAMYAISLKRFISELEDKLGRTFDEELFLNACIQPMIENDTGDYNAILGARVPPALLNECRNLSNLPIRDLTCSSQKRHFHNPPKSTDRSVLMVWYADSLLQQMPCLRMADTAARKELLADPALKGVIYHTIKFCDFYNFEYASMERAVPVLKLETDFMMRLGIYASPPPFVPLTRAWECGAKYRRRQTARGTKYAKPAWICTNFFSFGKEVCSSKQIPESILMNTSAKVLGDERFDASALEQLIDHIDVTGPNSLLYVFKDGREVPVEWKDHSRRDSWTDEMKQAARIKRIEAGRRQKNAEQ